MITKFVKGALRDVLVNKVRSFLTVLGILIGIASVTMMVSIGGSAQEYISQSITSRLGKNLIIVQPGGQSNGRGGVSFNFSSVLSSFTDDEYNAVKKLDSEQLDYVSRRLIASQSVSYAGAEADSLLYAVDPEYFKIVDIPLASGRYFRIAGDNNQEVILGQGLAKKLFKLQSPLNRQISIDGRDFTVIGVVEDVAGAAFGSETLEVYMDIRTYRNAFNKPERVNAVVIAANNNASMDLVEKQLERALRNARDLAPSEDADFSITTQSDIIETSTTILGTVTLFIAVISAISLIVGGIGVMNIMLVSVKERVKEIGLRKAIGATNQDIQTQILVEAVLFSLIGGLLGILVGAAGALLIEQVGGLPLYISTNAILTSIGVSSFVGIVFGLYPAIQAGRLSPIEALRSN
ncbi:MAG: ABC transporter permease [Patescibacteria group bacterium]|jgi:putative ABC transport system permease protein